MGASVRTETGTFHNPVFRLRDAEMQLEKDPGSLSPAPGRPGADPGGWRPPREFGWTGRRQEIPPGDFVAGACHQAAGGRVCAPMAAARFRYRRLPRQRPEATDF